MLDEADAFVAAEKHSGYALARAMRALKEEGRAYFVLVGYWELYAAAALSADHPLRNFGETVRLGPAKRPPRRDRSLRCQGAQTSGIPPDGSEERSSTQNRVY